MSCPHVRRKTFGRLSLSIERQAVCLFEPEKRECKRVCDGSNTELGI